MHEIGNWILSCLFCAQVAYGLGASFHIENRALGVPNRWAAKAEELQGIKWCVNKYNWVGYIRYVMPKNIFCSHALKIEKNQLKKNHFSKIDIIWNIFPPKVNKIILKKKVLYFSFKFEVSFLINLEVSWNLNDLWEGKLMVWMLLEQNE